MKRTLFLTLLCAVLAAHALAEPRLDAVIADDVTLKSGEDGWFVEFDASEDGTMAMELLSGVTGDKVADLGAVRVEAGTGRIGWNGLLSDGSAVPAGDYMVGLQMRGDSGEESAEYLLSVEILGGAAAPLDLSAANGAPEALTGEEMLGAADAALTGEEMLSAADAAGEELPGAAGIAVKQGVPVATSFWDMDPDLYDLTNPEHQQAIWDIMMQPITVISGEQTENVYITTKPGVSARPYKDNCAGELHGQSQGVHVLQETADGYALIEAYSNDGTKSESEYVESLAAKRVQGYIKKSRLYTDQPSDKYAILVDKLRQKLFLFEDGRIISELLVSTGLNNKNQPYNETPAGEFLTVSRVGDFKAGSRTIGRFAIRINGGTLLHEVLHDVNADGTRNYANYEPDLGQKASHGCIRIPRRKNADGINMEWFWNNLENKTKVIIWDDKDREMYKPELPEDSLRLYRNPDGGSSYHLDRNCSGVRDKYLPLAGELTYGDLTLDEYKKLTPCAYCGAPLRKSAYLEMYKAAAEEAGIEIPEAYLAMFE